jgi:sphingolipid 8-(E)-desaturase
MPFFANTPEFFQGLYSSYYKRVLTFDLASRLMVSIQHKIFYLVMSLARFNLYRLSYAYLVSTAFQPKRARGGRWWWWLEIVCIALFFTWYTAVLRGIPSWSTRILYLLISNVVPSPLHVQVCCPSIFIFRPDLIVCTLDCVISLLDVDS